MATSTHRSQGTAIVAKASFADVPDEDEGFAVSVDVVLLVLCSKRKKISVLECGRCGTQGEGGGKVPIVFEVTIIRGCFTKKVHRVHSV